MHAHAACSGSPPQCKTFASVYPLVSVVSQLTAVLNQCQLLPFTVPDPPTSVQASQVGEGRVQVTWNRPTNIISGFTLSVTSQSLSTTIPSESLSHTLITIVTGTHEISVVSHSILNGHTLYSTQATDTVEVLGNLLHSCLDETH